MYTMILIYKMFIKAVCKNILIAQKQIFTACLFVCLFWFQLKAMGPDDLLKTFVSPLQWQGVSASEWSTAHQGMYEPFSLYTVGIEKNHPLPPLKTIFCCFALFYLAASTEYNF